MKMMFRVLLGIYSFLSMILSLFVLNITIFERTFLDKALNDAAVELNIPWIYNKWTGFWLFIISLIWVIMNIYIFLQGIKGGKEHGEIITETAVGVIKISSQTFENITINVVRKITGIRDAKAYVHIKDNDVRITVRAVFLSDVNIPLLSEEAQKRIKQTVETSTGVIVDKVTILVDSVYTVYKGRVE